MTDIGTKKKRRGNIRRMVRKGTLRKAEDERKKIIMYREEKQEKYFPLKTFPFSFLRSPPPKKTCFSPSLYQYLSLCEFFISP